MLCLAGEIVFTKSEYQVAVRSILKGKQVKKIIMNLYKLLYLLCILVSAHVYSQPTFSINLRVETNQTYTVYHNEPLIFTTSLLNQTLQQDQEWNRASNEWLAEVTANYNAGKLTQEEFEKEIQIINDGKKQIEVTTIGRIQLPWFRQLQFHIFRNNIELAQWPIRILGDPLTDSMAVLDETGYYLVRHHLSPKQVASRAPGTYEIKVFLAGVWSNAVTVNIKPEDMPDHVLKSRTMQLRLGNYYLETKNTERAIVYANEVLKKNQFDIDGLILRGEIYILQKKFKRALTDFKLALQQYEEKFPDSVEPPDYIQRTIAMLEEKLKDSNP